jgi:hypothetical protein
MGTRRTGEATHVQTVTKMGRYQFWQGVAKERGHHDYGDKEGRLDMCRQEPGRRD